MAEQGQLPRIGDPAPDFTATTSHIPKFNFSAWQEQDWVVFFSHPADFTPVCTTELIEFSRQFERFRQKGVKLVGVSVDSIHSHLAWLQNIKDKLGETIRYPLIADDDKKVSHLYGMIHPGTSTSSTVRAVFVIDPKRIIRALIYYPMNAGRNVEEIFRLVAALQTADQSGCATPVNWQEGGKVLLPPPQTFNDIEERLSHTEWEIKDFYLSLKDLPTSSKKPDKPE